jgi:hypothetical protein
MTATKQGARQGRKTSQKAGAGAPDQEVPDQEATAGPGLRARVDQMGALLTKGLDLAEAGLGLGVTLVSRVGEAAQHQILERFMSQAAAAAASVAPGGEAPMPPAPEPEMSPPPAPAPESYGITNRLPLPPGGTARVSFSINNDSMAAPKKVALSLEGFVGEAHGRHLDAAGFTVKPARKTIAPMDFEKFALEGAVPPKAPPDVYRGWVVVSSDNELRIPIALVVSSL